MPTRVQRAIDHLTLFKTATDEQIRDAMGLSALAAPKAYLASAIKTGRVSKGANGWQLGRCDPVRKPFSISTPKCPVAQFDKHAQPVTKEEVKDLPPAVVEQLSKPAQELAKEDHDEWIEVPEVDPPAIAQAPSPAVFRCGLWSDGVLELQRNGRTVVMLDQGEHEQLGAFMRRMLGAAEQVAA